MKNKFLAGLSSFLFFAIPVEAQMALTNDSLLVDGHYRSFHFSEPASSSFGASLVFVLHGSGGDGKSMARRAGKLEEKASSEKFIAVYPDGYKRFWNECRKSANSDANIENIDEIAFFEAMIRYFKERYHINERNVFAVGTSGGGHMAYKLGLLAPRRFRAITALIANLPDEENMDCAGMNIPLPVMIVNGTDDAVNPYNGGQVRAGNFNPGTVRSTEASFRYWANLAGYKGVPKKVVLPDTDPSDGRIIERYTFQQGNKPEVVLLKVIGGKHDYPNDIDVHVEAWEFFKRQISSR